MKISSDSLDIPDNAWPAEFEERLLGKVLHFHAQCLLMLDLRSSL